MMISRGFAARLRFLAVVCLLLLPAPLAGQEAQNPSGHWKGAIALPGTPLEFDLDLAAANDGWSGDISIPRQGARDVVLTGIALTGTEITFQISGIPGDPTFRGTLSADGRTISGTFVQAGQTFPFTMERAADAQQASLQALAGIEEWIEKSMQDWRVPGMAVAIVKDGQVVFSQGFGYRDVAARQPATSQTLFAIGSASKAFTTFVLGQLVDEGKLEWDEPVRRYLPGLRLQDEYATNRLTAVDMVTHRSGLPRHDLAWYNSTTYDAAAVLARMPEFQPNRQLRQQFQYNNIMYALAGQLIGELNGKSWEESVRALIFEPLGMHSSLFSVHDVQRSPDHALPYGEAADTLRRLGFRDLNNAIAPAGAIYSNVEDMAKWMLVHLNRGKAGDRQLVQPATLRFMHSPQTVVPGVPQEPELSARTYGLGWFIDDYRGHYRVEHGGNIDGFTALVSLFPHDNLGVVVLANKNGTPLPQFVVRNVADRMFGATVRDWSGQALERAKASRALAQESEQRTAAARRRGTRPSLPLAEYAGDYEHPAYGVLSITHRSGRLAMRYNDIDTPLEHWHFDVFNGLENPADPAFRNLKLMFVLNVEGEIEALTVPFEPSVERIAFRRAADPQLSDPAYLQRFVGTYQLGPQTVTIALNGNVLTSAAPNQPIYELVPGRNNEFALKGLNGYRVQFVLDNRGRVTEALYKQPNGIFPAKRTE